ncbi:hypothetical protein CBM2586_B90063 [Cupriavidus phytorum]|uniref:Uncharacterized protein n=1 Tax=Cupriavidus taiwanensis TaxID=164546 RepID=A0A976FRV8_9BURK|nr:hypothetical protein CBM2586_B90063 [Cupriavidus taiwanensis]
MISSQRTHAQMGRLQLPETNHGSTLDVRRAQAPEPRAACLVSCIGLCCAGAAACRRAGRQRCRRRGLSGQADPVRGAVRGRRPDRHHGAHGRPPALRRVEEAHRGGQPAGRQCQYRRRAGRQGAARRLHLAGGHVDARVQRDLVSQAAVQHAERPGAGGAHRLVADDGGGACQLADQVDEGPGRGGAESQAERRLERQRHAAAPDAGIVRKPDPHQLHPCAVQGRRAVDDRPDRRPDRRGVLQLPRVARLCEGRQAARAGRDHARTPSAAARRAHRGRGWLSGADRRELDRPDDAGRHAPADRRQGGGFGRAHAGHRVGARAHRQRGLQPCGRRAPVCRLLQRRGDALGPADRGEEHPGRIAPRPGRRAGKGCPAVAAVGFSMIRLIYMSQSWIGRPPRRRRCKGH